MCGRFAQPLPLGEIKKVFFIDEIEDEPEVHYNISPGQKIAAVVGLYGRKHLTSFTWGLVPFWAKDPSGGNKLINARGETLHSKPSFRNAFESRRCLIIAAGFFEWRKGGKIKQPFYIHLASRECFAFAGLHEKWVSPDGRELRTCTIITTEPNEILKDIHNRMPVILSQRDEAVWLDPSVPKPELLSLMKPYPPEEMAYYRVSTTVNSTRNDSPDCIKPL